jgi:hypothetical protein
VDESDAANRVRGFVGVARPVWGHDVGPSAHAAGAVAGQAHVGERGPLGVGPGPNGTGFALLSGEAPVKFVLRDRIAEWFVMGRTRVFFVGAVGDALLAYTHGATGTCVDRALHLRGLLSVDIAVPKALYERCGWFTHWQEAMSLDGEPEPRLELKLRWMD